MFNNQQIALIRRLWIFIPPKRKFQFLILLILTIFSAFLDVFSLGAIFPYLGIILTPQKVLNNTFYQKLLLFLNINKGDNLLIFFTFLFITLIIISTLFKFFLFYFQSKLSSIVASGLSKTTFNNTINQNYEFHLYQKSSEVISGVNKSNGIAGNTIIPIITIINSILLIFFIFITLTIINPNISITVIVFTLIFYLFVIKITNKRIKQYGKIMSHNATKIIQIIQESLGGIKDIIIRRNQDFYTRYYLNKNIPLLESMAKVDFISTIPRYLLESLSIISLITFIFFLSKSNGNIQAYLPTIAALVVSLQRLLPVIQQLYANITKLKSNEASLKKVLYYLELEPLQKFKSTKENIIFFNKEIKLINISFKYQSDSKFILSDLNLSIKKGNKIGFVGESGSGKSTLLDLLVGLLKPFNGNIQIDDIVLNDENIHNWMKKISHVPQTIFLADSTIAENIAFGLPLKNIDLNRVKKVCEIAQIADTIEGWPISYNTLVGERGVRLSGGQRQRIGIARALYNNSEILILDEATSALDEKTEFAVMNELQKISHELTLLIIAHRISTLKYCDKIFEIQNENLNVYNSFEDYLNKKVL